MHPRLDLHRAARRAVRTALALLALSVAPAAMAQTPPLSPFIQVDQIGYLTGSRKVAILSDPRAGANADAWYAAATGQNEYQLRRAGDDQPVWWGTVEAWRNGEVHAQSGDAGWWLDFSAVNEPGRYYVYDAIHDVRSPAFYIGPAVYDATLRQAVRMLYYQRLGHNKTINGQWLDGPAYLGPGQDSQARNVATPADPASLRDLRGGWMDAGDSGKYTTYLRDVMVQLMEAYRRNPVAFRDDTGIPESGNGIPDLLDEVQWQLDFLMRMQDATGTRGLLLKVGVASYDGGFSPLSGDTRARFYVGECTSATLSGALAFATASTVYRGVPARALYGAELLRRAREAWERARNTTSGFVYFQTDCDDGQVKAGDADLNVDEQRATAVAAAVYLYEATGEAPYREFVEAYFRDRVYMRHTVRSANEATAQDDWWWGPYQHHEHLALLRFAGLPGVSSGVSAYIRGNKAAMDPVMSVDQYLNQEDLYRAQVDDEHFVWGHNQVRANVGNINLDFIDNGINPWNHLAYREIAEQHLHWLHGANPLGLMMLSNMSRYGASKSINEIYHAWFVDGSGWDSALNSNGPPPGYLVGGPNKRYQGPVPGIADQPPQKAFRNFNNLDDGAPQLNEPQLSYQASYILLLSRLMKP